jgi:hypothetical protein
LATSLVFFTSIFNVNFGNQGQPYLLQLQVNIILIGTNNLIQYIVTQLSKSSHFRTVFKKHSKLQFGTTKTHRVTKTLNGNIHVPRQMDLNSLYMLGRKLKPTLTWHYVLLIFLCAYCGYFCHEILNVYVYDYFYVVF